MTENENETDSLIELNILYLQEGKVGRLVYRISQLNTINEIKGFISQKVQKSKDKIVLYCRDKLCEDSLKLKEYLKISKKTQEIKTNLTFEMCLLKEFYHPNKGVKNIESFLKGEPENNISPTTTPTNNIISTSESESESNDEMNLNFLQNYANKNTEREEKKSQDNQLLNKKREREERDTENKFYVDSEDLIENTRRRSNNFNDNYEKKHYGNVDDSNVIPIMLNPLKFFEEINYSFKELTFEEVKKNLEKKEIEKKFESSKRKMQKNNRWNNYNRKKYYNNQNNNEINHNQFYQTNNNFQNNKDNHYRQNNNNTDHFINKYKTYSHNYDEKTNSDENNNSFIDINSIPEKKFSLRVNEYKSFKEKIMHVTYKNKEDGLKVKRIVPIINKDYVKREEENQSEKKIFGNSFDKNYMDMKIENDLVKTETEESQDEEEHRTISIENILRNLYNEDDESEEDENNNDVYMSEMLNNTYKIEDEQKEKIDVLKDKSFLLKNLNKKSDHSKYSLIPVKKENRDFTPQVTKKKIENEKNSKDKDIIYSSIKNDISINFNKEVKEENANHQTKHLTKYENFRSIGKESNQIENKNDKNIEKEVTMDIKNIDFKKYDGQNEKKTSINLENKHFSKNSITETGKVSPKSLERSLINFNLIKNQNEKRENSKNINFIGEKFRRQDSKINYEKDSDLKNIENSNINSFKEKSQDSKINNIETSKKDQKINIKSSNTHFVKNSSNNPDYESINEIEKIISNNDASVKISNKKNPAIGGSTNKFETNIKCTDSNENLVNIYNNISLNDLKNQQKIEENPKKELETIKDRIDSNTKIFSNNKNNENLLLKQNYIFPRQTSIFYSRLPRSSSSLTNIFDDVSQLFSSMKEHFKYIQSLKQSKSFHMERENTILENDNELSYKKNELFELLKKIPLENAFNFSERVKINFVLDIDNTILHAKELLIPSNIYNLPKNGDFLELIFKNEKKNFFLSFRPHLKEFFEKFRSYTIFFLNTKGVREYAQKVAGKLSKNFGIEIPDRRITDRGTNLNIKNLQEFEEYNNNPREFMNRALILDDKPIIWEKNLIENVICSSKYCSFIREIITSKDIETIKTELYPCYINFRNFSGNINMVVLSDGFPKFKKNAPPMLEYDYSDNFQLKYITEELENVYKLWFLTKIDIKEIINFLRSTIFIGLSFNLTYFIRDINLLEEDSRNDLLYHIKRNLEIMIINMGGRITCVENARFIIIYEEQILQMINFQDKYFLNAKFITDSYYNLKSMIDIIDEYKDF